MKKKFLIIIILSTLTVGCNSYSGIDVTEKTKNIAAFNFEKDEKVDIKRLIIENENYLIPTGYLGDTYWSGDEELDKLLMIEIIDLLKHFVTFNHDILNNHLSEDEILNLTTPKHLGDKQNKWYNNVTYANNKIRPFHTKYNDYIGVEKIIQFIELKGVNDDDVYFEYSKIPNEWNVNIDYYHIDTDGSYTYDDEGYYKRLYEDKVKVEMIAGDLIDLNKYIDISSTTNFYFPISNSSNIVGMTRWTNDLELNKALLAYLLNEYSYDRVFVKDYITEFINEKDSSAIINKFDNWGPIEGSAWYTSELSIKNYNTENIFLISIVYDTDPFEGPEDYRESFQTHYVVKQADGKYKVYYEKASLPN